LSPSHPKSLSVGSAIARSGLVPIDAYALLSHVLARNRAWLIAHAYELLAP